jgi:glycogen synthase
MNVVSTKLLLIQTVNLRNHLWNDNSINLVSPWYSCKIAKAIRKGFSRYCKWRTSWDIATTKAVIKIDRLKQKLDRKEVLHLQYLEKPFLIALAILQLYHGETKLIQWDDDEVRFVSDQYV